MLLTQDFQSRVDCLNSRLFCFVFKQRSSGSFVSKFWLAFLACLPLTLPLSSIDLENSKNYKNAHFNSTSTHTLRCRKKSQNTQQASRPQDRTKCRMLRSVDSNLQLFSGKPLVGTQGSRDCSCPFRGQTICEILN